MLPHLRPAGATAVDRDDHIVRRQWITELGVGLSDRLAGVARSVARVTDAVGCGVARPIWLHDVPAHDDEAVLVARIGCSRGPAAGSGGTTALSRSNGFMLQAERRPAQ